MPKLKIDRVKLNQLLNSGKSQREVAQVFGVIEGAISKAKKPSRSMGRGRALRKIGVAGHKVRLRGGGG